LAGEEPKPIGGLPQRKRGAPAPLTRCGSPPKPEPWLGGFWLVIFLRSSPPPGGAVAYFFCVGPKAIAGGPLDPAGIVFNGRFFEFFDHSTWLMFEEVLATKSHEIRARFDIIGFPVVDVRARFFKPLTYGIVVDIETTIREFRNSSFDVLHRLS